MNDLTFSIRQIGMGLFAIGFSFLVIGLVSPGPGAWLVSYVAKPIPFYITMGLMIGVGLTLMCLEAGSKDLKGRTR